MTFIKAGDLPPLTITREIFLIGDSLRLDLIANALYLFFLYIFLLGDGKS